MDGIDGHRFTFFVISAALEEVIRSALADIVPESHIFGTSADRDVYVGDAARTST